MKRHARSLPVLSTAMVALIFVSTGSVSRAHDDEIPFDEAELFFELNNTDGDLGIHALIDGEAWKKLEIEDSREREILKVSVRGRLRRQGLTEIFFESAEPTFDELSPEDFFRRFEPAHFDESSNPGAENLRRLFILQLFDFRQQVVTERVPRPARPEIRQA